MDKWLTLKQTSEYLQIGLSTLYRLVRARKIPGHKIGRQWRFKKEEIDRWISEGRAREDLRQSLAECGS